MVRLPRSMGAVLDARLIKVCAGCPGVNAFRRCVAIGGAPNAMERVTIFQPELKT